MTKVTFTPAEVLTVEKGNVDRVTSKEISIEQCVVAFTIKPCGFEKSVKALLKGKIAYHTYNMYLADVFTKADVLKDEEDFFMVKVPSAGFTGRLREQRPKEVIYDNIKELEFLFHYKVIQK